MGYSVAAVLRLRLLDRTAVTRSNSNHQPPHEHQGSVPPQQNDQQIGMQDLLKLMTAMASNQGGHNSSSGDVKFKPTEIGYFDPHLSQSQYGKGDWVHMGNDVWYRDVHLFITQAKTIAATKHDGYALVRKNLNLCLRGDAQAWYAAELDDVYQWPYKMMTV